MSKLTETMNELNDMASFKDFGKRPTTDKCSIDEHVPTDCGERCICGYFVKLPPTNKKGTDETQ